MDIFEMLKTRLRCMYISDLKFSPYKDMAVELLCEMNADSKQMLDVYNYLGIQL